MLASHHGGLRLIPDSKIADCFHHWRWKLIAPDRLWYRTECGGDIHGLHVLAQPAARQSFIFKWGAAGWGEYYTYVCVWLKYLPRRPMWTACIQFCDLRLSTSRNKVSTFSGYPSLWMLLSLGSLGCIVAIFLVPDWGVKADSDIGLSCRHARLPRLASRFNNPVPESTISPHSGTVNLATEFWRFYNMSVWP